MNWSPTIFQSRANEGQLQLPFLSYGGSGTSLRKLSNNVHEFYNKSRPLYSEVVINLGENQLNYFSF